MQQRYRTRGFAELTGVTIKALRHYERLGLLKPARTPAGYRIYSEAERERVEQILALRFLGAPLKLIRIVLDRKGHDLAEALRAQRKALEEKQKRVALALRAVRAAEANSELKKIIEVIGMQSDIDAMRKYYTSGEAWEKARPWFEDGPSREWRQLYADVRAASDADPAGDTAQSLAERYLRLAIRAKNGDPEARMCAPAAWLDRANWPASLNKRFEEFQLDEFTRFLSRAAVAARKRYFSDDVWAKLDVRNFTSYWQERTDLFAEIEASLDEDPAGATGQRLAAKWQAHLDSIGGGDPEVKTALAKTWSDRRNWRATLLYREEALSRMEGERFERAAAFLDRALAAA
jgi:DNA-binding transcriptional MerR regulator